ncbi:hypothetical protein [Marinobacterium sp. xm-d-564]|uniref:hypothetical protein n=1 Tax=Marinobacterium sp. xm-d-564 TaxID=2497742 RepID=UPI001569523C|nr:hypothetical protein [Marinobacterium sp. xm-d-564]NRP60110.1 hypothetical protein [Marinobacterium sp. xm-d-564]
MNEAPLRLFDILPMVDHSSNLALMAILSLAVLFTLFIAIWYRFFTPLAKLQRALSNQSMTPRQGCHQLAGIMVIDTALLQELNRLRFQPAEPTLDEVQTLIKRARHVL